VFLDSVLLLRRRYNLSTNETWDQSFPNNILKMGWSGSFRRREISFTKAKTRRRGDDKWLWMVGTRIHSFEVVENYWAMQSTTLEQWGNLDTRSSLTPQFPVAFPLKRLRINQISSNTKPKPISNHSAMIRKLERRNEPPLTFPSQSTSRRRNNKTKPDRGDGNSISASQVLSFSPFVPRSECLRKILTCFCRPLHLTPQEKWFLARARD
jgi:hypothetical protein